MINHGNGFRECLQLSHDAHALPLWREMYKATFPTMVEMVDHTDSGWWQLAGIDRSIVLSSSVVVYVDEKIRGRNARTNTVYSDIALEFVSNDARSTPGWVCKPLAAHYIAYAIAPLGVGYMLPVIHLQQAWSKHNQKWTERYGVRRAKNNGYNTLFCPVPPDVVFRAIGQELRCKFDACDLTEATT